MLASGWDDLVDVEERLMAIQAVRPTENFEPLAASFKRIQNILKQAQFQPDGEIERGLLDFPTTIDGQEAYWCWQAGEAEIEWWHPRDTGFAGRRRIASV